MTSVAYLVTFVLTSREYDYLAKKWGLENRVSPLQVKAFEERGHCLRVYVRQHTRLFLKIYIYSKIAVLLASTRVPILRHVAEVAKVSGSITLMSAGYRALFLTLKHFVQIYGDKESYNAVIARIVISAVSGALGTAAFRLLPSYTRDHIAIYVAVKALEYLYNRLEDAECLNWKPSFVGSWMLFPISMSQLVPMFFMTPFLVPASFKRIMLIMRGSYGPIKPHGYPKSAPWPSTNAWLASIGEIASQKFPKFGSTVIYRNIVPVSEKLEPVKPILDMAHPGIKKMTSAVLHPCDSSEVRPFVTTAVAGFTSSAKYLLPLYLAKQMSTYGRSIGLDELIAAVAGTLRTSAFMSMTTTSIWAGVGLSQSILGTKLPPKLRFRIIGLLSGLWALIDTANGRARNLFCFRLAIISKLYEIRSTRPKRARIPYGDSFVFAVSMAAIFAIYNSGPDAISSVRIRKTLNFMQTGVYKDPAPLSEFRRS